jgi:hypothetical protein
MSNIPHPETASGGGATTIHEQALQFAEAAGRSDLIAQLQAGERPGDATSVAAMLQRLGDFVSGTDQPEYRFPLNPAEPGQGYGISVFGDQYPGGMDQAAVRLCQETSEDLICLTGADCRPRPLFKSYVSPDSAIYLEQQLPSPFGFTLVIGWGYDNKSRPISYSVRALRGTPAQ